MKKIVTLWLLLLAGKVLGQGAGAELYQYNYNFIHPAFAGSEGQRVSILGQTAGYDRSFGDTKQTMLQMGYENYFEKLNSGIAVTGYSERFGPSSVSSLALSYNYTFTFGESSKLITSVRTGARYHSLSGTYRSVTPSDPILDVNLSASNWTADLGLLLRTKDVYVGALANNLAHTNATLDLINSPVELKRSFAAILGTSVTLSERLTSQHSLYIPFDIEGYRIDLNNTLTINDLFIVGLSMEKYKDKFFARANAGVRVKDYFQIVFLLYSGRRNESITPESRGEVIMTFGF